MNITKQKLESDNHALKAALKLLGYDPTRIIIEHDEIKGKYSDRNIKKRVRKEDPLRPGAQEFMDKYNSMSNKSCGVE